MKRRMARRSHGYIASNIVACIHCCLRQPTCSGHVEAVDGVHVDSFGQEVENRDLLVGCRHFLVHFLWEVTGMAVKNQPCNQTHTFVS